jgi:thiol peroxidase
MLVRLIIAAGVGAVGGALVGVLARRMSATAATRGSLLGLAIFGAGAGAVGALVGFAGSPAAAASAAVVHVRTPEQFTRDVLEADRPVLVDFYTDACGYCKVLAPTIASLADEYAGRATVAKVNAARLGGIAREYEILGVPTVLLFSGGREVRRWPGVQDADVYRRALAPLIARHASITRRKGKDAAMPRRDHAVTMKGKPLTLLGREVKVGDKAPDFTAVGTDLEEAGLSDFAGKTVVILSVPSLDTAVCSTEAKRFNEEAAKLGDDVRVVVVSMDLPFAQKRWCGAEGVDRVVTLSDHRAAAFGQAYGVLIEGLRLLARAVFVVAPDGTVTYTQLVEEITDEPDYDAALAAAGKAAG